MRRLQVIACAVMAATWVSAARAGECQSTEIPGSLITYRLECGQPPILSEDEPGDGDLQLLIVKVPPTDPDNRFTVVKPAYVESLYKIGMVNEVALTLSVEQPPEGRWVLLDWVLDSTDPVPVASIVLEAAPFGNANESAQAVRLSILMHPVAGGEAVSSSMTLATQVDYDIFLSAQESPAAPLGAMGGSEQLSLGIAVATSGNVKATAAISHPLSDLPSGYKSALLSVGLLNGQYPLGEQWQEVWFSAPIREK